MTDENSYRNEGMVSAIDEAMNLLMAAKMAYQSDEEDEPMDISEMKDDEEYRAVNLDAPAFMQDNAKRGLKLHEEGFSGDGLKPQTVEDARKMVAGVVTEEKWRKIGAWIARHMSDLDAVEGEEITAGLVAMLLWGGGSTKTEAQRTMDYAYSIVERLDAVESNSVNQYDWQIMTDTMQWVATDINEKRSIAYSNLELRAESDGNTIVGYAAIWDSPSEPMPFIEYVKRGDLSQMSFAFRTVKDNWNNDRSVRELREVQLFDVSVVTFPAYEETVAELRSKNTCVTVPVTTGVLLRKNEIALQKYRSR